MISDSPARFGRWARATPEASLVGILGIGSKAWDRCSAGPAQRCCTVHRVARPAHRAVDPGDLLIHPKADVTDCYEVATKVTDAPGGNATIVDEAHGFRYLTCATIGFVDGTENPTGQDAIDADHRRRRGPVPTGQLFAIQRYARHARGTSLSTESQEVAIGRTKPTTSRWTTR